jgi:hypothetical protein
MGNLSFLTSFTIQSIVHRLLLLTLGLLGKLFFSRSHKIQYSYHIFSYFNP